MKNLLTYKAISKLSSQLLKNLKGEENNLEICSRHQQEIESALITDLKNRIKEDFQVASSTFIIDDSSYRQSSRGLIQVLTSLDKKVELRVESLIDHNRIWVKSIKTTKKIEKFFSEKRDDEGQTELKDLKRKWL